MAWSTVLTGYVLLMTAGLSGWALAMWPPKPFNPLALTVVVCATVGYLLCCHTAEELRAAFRPPATGDPQAVRAKLIELARIARLEGGRGLDREVRGLTADPLGAAGLRLAGNGSGPLQIDQALGELAARAEAAARLPIEVWSSVARGALHAGAMLSLVQLTWALVALPPDQAIGAVAAALGSTFWGLGMAWLVAQPQILRARRAGRVTAEVNRLWVTGWRAIAEGIHPLRLEDRLAAERAA